MNKNYPEAQGPIILRSLRLMETFAKSNDEQDFYLDQVEGFLLLVDLDKTDEELESLEKELKECSDRYHAIPKLTFYESKKIMEHFVNEKVYDIDAKEKLSDIIQGREAREHFLEYIYDNEAELEKWQQFYQERSRIRIIEWLREHQLYFVFEEDLDLSAGTIEKLKIHLFDKKVPQDVSVARKSLVSKAKSYYSTEALNPRPKRGRPPKQAQKVEHEPQISTDIYTKVPPVCRPFLFTPEITSISDVTFSAKFSTAKNLVSNKRDAHATELEKSMNSINQKLATLRRLSTKWIDQEPSELAREMAPDVDSDFGKEEQKLLKKLEEKRKAKKKTKSIVADTKKTARKSAVKRTTVKKKT